MPGLRASLPAWHAADVGASLHLLIPAPCSCQLPGAQAEKGRAELARELKGARERCRRTLTTAPPRHSPPAREASVGERGGGGGVGPIAG